MKNEYRKKRLRIDEYRIECTVFLDLQEKDIIKKI
jgi:hypothetical protein